MGKGELRFNIAEINLSIIINYIMIRTTKIKIILSLLLCMMIVIHTEDANAIYSAHAVNNLNIVGDYNVVSISQYSNLTVRFNNNYISIRGGCNTQTGFFQSDPSGKVTIGPFLSGSNDCKNSTDARLADLLTNADKISQKGQIIFTMKDSSTITLQAASASGSSVNLNTFIADYEGSKNSSAKSSTSAKPADSTSTSVSTNASSENANKQRNPVAENAPLKLLDLTELQSTLKATNTSSSQNSNNVRTSTDPTVNNTPKDQIPPSNPDKIKPTTSNEKPAASSSSNKSTSSSSITPQPTQSQSKQTSASQTKQQTKIDQPKTIPPVQSIKTIGPGPKDPSLPPVLDLSSLTVDINTQTNKKNKMSESLSNQSSTSTSTTSKSSSSSSSSASSVSSTSSLSKQSVSNEQPITKNVQNEAKQPSADTSKGSNSNKMGNANTSQNNNKLQSDATPITVDYRSYVNSITGGTIQYEQPSPSTSNSSKSSKLTVSDASNPAKTSDNSKPKSSSDFTEQLLNIIYSDRDDLLNNKNDTSEIKNNSKNSKNSYNAQPDNQSNTNSSSQNKQTTNNTNKKASTPVTPTIPATPKAQQNQSKSTPIKSSDSSSSSSKINQSTNQKASGSSNSNPNVSVQSNQDSSIKSTSTTTKKQSTSSTKSTPSNTQNSSNGQASTTKKNTNYISGDFFAPYGSTNYESYADTSSYSSSSYRYTPSSSYTYTPSYSPINSDQQLYYQISAYSSPKSVETQNKPQKSQPETKNSQSVKPVISPNSNSNSIQNRYIQSSRSTFTPVSYTSNSNSNSNNDIKQNTSNNYAYTQKNQPTSKSSLSTNSYSTASTSTTSSTSSTPSTASKSNKQPSKIVAKDTSKQAKPKVDTSIYLITPSYQSYSNYFIASTTDQYIDSLKEYLENNYYNYINGGDIIAAFKQYNSGYLQYQLLYSTRFGTFGAILTYYPQNQKIVLKSLAILNFSIMQIDYSNCDQKDYSDQNCSTCSQGYRNFKGRCTKSIPYCNQYLTDQCAACSDSKTLNQGVCI